MSARGLYLEGSRGDLLAIWHAPADGGCRGAVLVVSALGEEMNKCRPMVAEQARALADAGFAVLSVDPFGTGDSAGDWPDADWVTWVEDAAASIRWLGERCPGAPLTVLAVRGGALLATAALAACPETPASLVLWQPVLSGDAWLTQFLRLRTAAAALQGGAREEVGELKTRFEQGEAVEVAGYVIPPGVAGGLRSAELMPSLEGLGPRLRVTWLEASTKDEPRLSAASRRAVEGLEAGGVAVDAAAVVGEPFWATQEIAMAPALIAMTTSVIEGGAGESSYPYRPPVERPATSDGAERVVHFDCQGAQLVGVLHRASGTPTRAVLVVVGGPQYRVGSHRQFVTLARDLAAAGFPVLRFDYRGMGDSEGAFVGFEGVDDDIRAGLDALCRECPSVREVVLWGLCDGASAAGFYAHGDSRVAGLVAVNPWVRTEAGIAKAYLRHYYVQRLLNRDFWRGVLDGRVSIGRSVAGLWADIVRARGGGPGEVATPEPAAVTAETSAPPASAAGSDFTPRLADGLQRFRRPVLLVLSGNDLTAREFEDWAKVTSPVRKRMRAANWSTERAAEADHTFSRVRWKGELGERVVSWLKAI